MSSPAAWPSVIYLEPQRHIAVYTDRAIVVGFVEWNELASSSNDASELPARPVASDLRNSDTSLSYWTWAATNGIEPLAPHNIYTFPVPRVELADNFVWATTWREDDDEVFSTVLGEAWNWRDQEAPSICTHLRGQTQGIRSAVDQWQRFIMPAAGQILHGLYCPSGKWSYVDAEYTFHWAAAAAKIAFGWLAFYDRADAPQSRDHMANHLKLRRIAALALAGWALDQPNALWATAAEGKEKKNPYVMTSMLADALKQWQIICLDDSSAWLFDSHWWVVEDRLSKTPLGSREQRREHEMNELTRVIEALLQRPRVGQATEESMHDLKHRLYTLLDVAARNWYRPRYDFDTVERLEQKATEQHHHVKSSLPLLTSLFLWFTRLPRLYGGIIAGYLATAFAGDTWKLLFSFAQTKPNAAYGSNDVHIHVYALFVLATLASVCAIVVYQFLAGRLRFLQSSNVGRRVCRIFLRAEGVSCFIGILLALFLSPLPLAGEPIVGVVTDIALWVLIAFGAGVFYAQFALVIGVFTQLLFDNRAATDRLN